MRIIFPWPTERYNELAPSFKAFGGIVPSPDLSKIAVAETDEGEIVGWFCVQFVLHAEPAWVRASRNTRGVYEELQRIVTDFINETPAGTPVFAIADSQATARRCESMKMAEIERPVYIGFAGMR